jgi:hypothetical protein
MTTTTRPLLALLGAAALAGCTSTGGGLAVTVDVSALTLPAASPGDPMLDSAGLADLSQFPLFVVARVEADDLTAPVIATWPETIPEEAPDEVTLELEVPPGQDRRVSLELVLVEEGNPAPALFVAPAPGAAPEAVDVAAGQTAEVRLELVDVPTAVLGATAPGPARIASIAWVDESLGAVLPPVEPDGEAIDAVLPAGRTYWPRVALADGSIRDLDAQRVLLDAGGTTTTLELDE